MAAKKCSKCGEVKEEDCYSWHRGRKASTGKPLPDKRRSICKDCERVQCRRRRRKNLQLQRLYGWHNRNIERWKYGHVRRGGDLTLEEYVLLQEAMPGWASQSHIDKWTNPKPQRVKHERCVECGEESNKRYCSDACYWRHKYRTDPAFNVRERIRNQFKKAFNGERKPSKAMRSLGYSMQELADHLEAQFVRGMSWDNYGEWHIDHIKPKNLFDLSDPEEVKRCWCLTNLRPLWAGHNCSRPKDGSDILL